MVSDVFGDQAAELADAMQAEVFRLMFDRERSDLAAQLSKLVKQSTVSMAAGNHQQVTELRRAIRHTENGIRKIDRMVDALEQRFPAEVRRRA